MVSDSLGALHVALAAAIAGWLVFSLSHAVSVWRKRNSAGDARGPGNTILIAGLFCCASALLISWIGRELTRRAGVIVGTDFYVVRARARAVPHLLQGKTADAGAVLAEFESPETERERERLRNEINVLEQQTAVEHLKPLTLNPELLRAAQDASDSQRSRLSQLGYGVLGKEEASAPVPPSASDDRLVAGEKARSAAAANYLARTKELAEEGVIARDQVDAAYAASQTADQTLHERQRLIAAAQTGSLELKQKEAAISRDSQRALAERNAEVAELGARIAGLRTTLAQIGGEQKVVAPFGGTIAYRHPSPALAGEGQVILALAKGAGFLGTIQMPAREAAMLAPGQLLRMKLQHSLISEEILGQLQEVRSVPGYPDRRELLIASELPPEQFSAFSSGVIPVTLLWRPPLYKDKLVLTGVGCLLVALVAWTFLFAFRRKPVPSAPSLDDDAGNEQSSWSYTAKEQELYQLGVRFGESLQANDMSPALLKQVRQALQAEPVLSEHLIRTALLEKLRPGEHPVEGAPFIGAIKQEVEDTLMQMGLSDTMLAEDRHEK